MRKGLGKGLGALLGDDADVSVSMDDVPQNKENSVLELKIVDVEPNAKQPRSEFDDEKLNELAMSIKEHGVISPILVKKSKNGFYSIIAGERRWRAAKIAGLKTIPAIIKNLDELEVHEVALIENLQRQDLNPVEEALGYKKLMDDFSLTQEQISQKMGKSRSSVANSLRILNLPKSVIELIKNKELSFGHAKVILSCDDKLRQEELAKTAVKNSLSVKALEELLKKKPAKEKITKKINLNLQLAFKAIEKSMSSSLGAKVKINDKGNKGTISIEYYSKEELERITKILNKEN